MPFVSRAFVECSSLQVAGKRLSELRSSLTKWVAAIWANVKRLHFSLCQYQQKMRLDDFLFIFNTRKKMAEEMSISATKWNQQRWDSECGQQLRFVYRLARIKFSLRVFFFLSSFRIFQIIYIIVDARRSVAICVCFEIILFFSGSSFSFCRFVVTAGRWRRRSILTCS